jgi:hypothetical protein
MNQQNNNTQSKMNKQIPISIEESLKKVNTIEARYGFKIVKTDDIRSSIFNEAGTLVGFSPLSSTKIDNMFSSNGDLNKENRVEEYVEGTMINVFNIDGEWKIATKSTVGGNNSFYMDGMKKQKSFKTMFYECCESNNLNLDEMDKTLMYSFVMQHTENRIINPVLSNQLYLISTYKFYENSNCVMMLMDYKIPECDVKYPKVYDLTSRDEIKKHFAMPYTDYKVMGVNIFNTDTGARSKMRNPCYEELKKLRGNQAKMEYHYLTLRKQKKVAEFLDFFPEYDESFKLYECKILNFQGKLFEKFNDCYLKRSKPLYQYEKQYKNHMFAIHDTYVKTREPTSMTTVDIYLKTIPEAVLMSSINYDYRNQE